MKVRDFMAFCFNGKFLKLRKVRDICAALTRNLFFRRTLCGAGVLF
jgi:hypothetical protein